MAQAIPEYHADPSAARRVSSEKQRAGCDMGLPPILVFLW